MSVEIEGPTGELYFGTGGGPVRSVLPDFTLTQWGQYVVVPTAGAGKAAVAIGEERIAQNKKWGPQSHPDGTSKDWELIRDHLRDLCDEVYEAAAEIDYDRLRKELVQVAAVAAAWIEDIDNRTDELNGRAAI
jgi:hypothetical protein